METGRKLHARRGSGNAVRAIAVLLCVMFVVEHAAAKQYQVGGTKGWVLGNSFSNWAKKTTVKPKDVLFFKYSAGRHNVIRVTKQNYMSCNAKGGLKYLSSGSDKFALSKAGTYYFICGVADHCKKGMKVTVTVK